MINNFRFISTFENYEKEESGRKRNHVVARGGLPLHKRKKLNAFIIDKKPLTITIQKAYTNEHFTRLVTDVTIWEGRVIVSW